MMQVLVGGLMLFCILLILYIFLMHKQLRELVEAVEQLNQKKYHKIFVKGNSLLSELALEINDVEDRQQADIMEINKIEQANKELLTSLSHDVRTPLTSLLGYLDALEDGIVSGEEKIQYITTARKKAYDLKNLVDSLFDWFKIYSNEMKLQSQITDVCELTRQIIIDWIPILEKSKINYNISVPEAEYFAYIDQAAYTRIVNNIIQNSIVHSECKNMKTCIKQQKDIVEITLQDDGIGINKAQLEHVFERLYKGDSSRSRKSSGLGLCIAKQLTEMMNGTITVESLQGSSACFVIKFPIVKG